MMRFWRKAGLVVCVVGGVVLGAMTGFDLDGDHGAILGAFVGMSAGYGLFSQTTGVV